MKKRIVSISLIISMFFLVTFSIIEPTMVKGVEDEITVSVQITGEISITSPSNVNLTTISGLTGGTSSGAATWNVKTNNSAGYNIGLKATSTPAMVDGANQIANYTPATPGTPDYNWSIGSDVAEFGFSPYNASSQVDKFKNSASACNTGSTITDGQCWYNFSTSNELVADRSTKTSETGEDTKVNFRVEYDISNGTQEEGTYSATIIATAVVN